MRDSILSHFHHTERSLHMRLVINLESAKTFHIFEISDSSLPIRFLTCRALKRRWKMTFIPLWRLQISLCVRSITWPGY